VSSIASSTTCACARPSTTRVVPLALMFMRSSSASGERGLKLASWIARNFSSGARRNSKPQPASVSDAAAAATRWRRVGIRPPLRRRR
jgi:hypothetical protein